MSFDPQVYELEDVPPAWLSDFVQFEVRPLVDGRQQALLEVWFCWLARHEEQQREWAAWDAERRAFFQGLAALPQEQQHDPNERPGDDLVWVEGWVNPRPVGGWAPARLSEKNEPPVDMPLPPRNRNPEPDECWVALMAVHDAVWDRRQLVGPCGSLPFESLRQRALRLTETDLSRLRAMVTRGRASLPLEAAGTRVLPASEPSAQAQPPAIEPAAARSTAAPGAVSTPSMSEQGPVRGPTKIAQAIATKRAHPDWTDKQVADTVECDPSTLSGSADYRAARDALAAEQAMRLNRSRRNRGNDMDAYPSGTSE